MSSYKDLGENSIALKLYRKYCRYGVSLQGLQLLARRALARGYPEVVVTYGLEEVIKKTISANFIMGTMC